MVSHPLVAVEILFRLGPLPLADWFFHFGAMVFGSAIAAEPVPRHGQSTPLGTASAPASWLLRARLAALGSSARHSRGEADPLGAQLPPRLLERAASQAAGRHPTAL